MLGSGLFKVRIDDDPAAMLTNDEFLVGSDVHETLRSDRVEAASAGVPVVDRNHREMIVHAGSDTIIGAHCPRVDLLGAILSD